MQTGWPARWRWNRDGGCAVGSAMRNAMFGAVLAMLLAGCVTATSAPPDQGPASVPPSVPVSASPSIQGADPVSADPPLAAIDAAQARWIVRRPSTFAFTLTHLGPSGVGWNWRSRVTSMGGRVQVQWLDGYLQPDDASASQSIDGLFDLLRRQLRGSGDLQMRFDPELGFPTEISYADRMVSDGDWTESISDFIRGGDDRRAQTRKVLRAARAAWQRWEPTSYEYVWRRFEAAAGPSSGSAWHVQHAGGRTSTEADPVSDGTSPADAASVASTFDRVAAALTAGAWVDLTVAPVSGVPTLVAVDPSTDVTGDEYWIRIAFRDTAHEDALSACSAALDRWAAARLQHFSYTWRYRGQYAPLTYGVTFDGDVSALRRSPGTPIPEASGFAAPRIDDTFHLIQQVLAQGGRVAATYDPILGYPVRVELDPAGDAGPRGTITITGFRAP